MEAYGCCPDHSCIHEAVFNDNLVEVTKIIEHNEGVVDNIDRHGNTPLHLAAILGYHDLMKLIISENPSLKIKNKKGWLAISEAVSFGNRDQIKCIYHQMKDAELKRLREELFVEALDKMKNFTMRLDWEVYTWIPVLSNFLPADSWRIYKKGRNIRLETTLIGLENYRWKRGNVCLIFNGEDKRREEGEKKYIFAVVNHSDKTFCHMNLNSTKTESCLEEEVDDLMTSPNVNGHLDTSKFHVSRVKKSWPFRGYRDIEDVGMFPATLYTMSGLTMHSVKRREHLLNKSSVGKQEDVMSEMSWFSTSSNHHQRTRVESLDPPPDPKSENLNFKDYIQDPSCIGRKQVEKSVSKAIKLNLAISQQFPINLDQIIDILEIFAPKLKMVQRLREFVSLQLPTGFPVMIDVPLIPSVTAKITFPQFEWIRGHDDDNILDDSMFQIPEGYVERDADSMGIDLTSSDSDQAVKKVSP